MKPIFTKEIRNIIKERTFASVFFMQLFMIIFYSVALFGLFIIFSPGSGDAGILVVENEYTNYELVSILRESFDVDLGNMQSGYDAVIEFTDTEPVIADIYADEEGFKTAYIVTELQKAFSELEDKLRDENVKGYISISGLVKKDITRINLIGMAFEFKHLILVPLLFFLPIYLSGVLFIDIFTEELSRKTLNILMVAPLKLKNIVNQKMAASIAVSFFQIIIWMFLFEARGIDIDNKLPVLFLLFLLNIIVLLISAIIALNFRSRGFSHTIFSFFVVFLLVTKDLAFNPIGVITRLAIIDFNFYYLLLPWLAVIFLLFLFYRYSIQWFES